MSKTRPIDQIRIGGVKAAIWRNPADDPRNPQTSDPQPHPRPRKGDRFNVTFERLYRDGDQWKSTRSFGRDDLLTLAKLADRVHSRILELQRGE